MAAGTPGDGAVDLGAIRRSEEIVDVLARRAAAPARMRRDPAVTLLRALAADIDSRDAVPGVIAGTRPGGTLPGGTPAGTLPGGPPARAGAWARALTAAAAAAGAAVTTGGLAAGVLAAGMLARLARNPARGSRPTRPAAGPGRPAQPASSLRRTP